MEIPTITIDPKAPHTHTIVFLHGRGDNAQRFSSRVRSWRDSQNRTFADAFPSFRWVFPQAPVRKCANLPCTWHQWFDVWSVEDFAEREEIQAQGLREVVPGIRLILGNEASVLGGRWDRVILAGISMGGATGVHTLFNLDVSASGGGGGRLGAFIGVACRCPLAGRSLLEMRRVLGLEGVPEHAGVVRNTPVLMEHNADDGTGMV
ncbi:Alpha/Beta hydrolase fold [Rhypophila decipiens]